jgi:hypothetical protein
MVKTDAKPALGTRQRTLSLNEEIEHIRHQVGGYSDAAILDPHHGRITLASDADLDLSAIGVVLDRVVQQIGDDLRESNESSVDHQRVSVPQCTSSVWSRRFPRSADTIPLRA